MPLQKVGHTETHLIVMKKKFRRYFIDFLALVYSLCSGGLMDGVNKAKALFYSVALREG